MIEPGSKYPICKISIHILQVSIHSKPSPYELLHKPCFSLSITPLHMAERSATRDGSRQTEFD
jgi:hypothetical protein